MTDIIEGIVKTLSILTVFFHISYIDISLYL